MYLFPGLFFSFFNSCFFSVFDDFSEPYPPCMFSLVSTQFFFFHSLFLVFLAVNHLSTPHLSLVSVFIPFFFQNLSTPLPMYLLPGICFHPSFFVSLCFHSSFFFVIYQQLFGCIFSLVSVYFGGTCYKAKETYYEAKETY